MGEKDPNIFDQAAGRPKKKKKKKELPATPPTEVEGMMEKIRSMDSEIRMKVAKITELSGMSSQEIATFLDNPHNFSEAEWKKMEGERLKLEEKIYTTLGWDLKNKKVQGKTKKMEKERRGKTIGSRKKWIPM